VQKQEETIKANPQLEEYSKKISSEEKKTSTEKKIIPITSVRKATEEEKTEIKKSSKFKKAIAAISAIVIAAGVALGAMSAAKTNTIDTQSVTYTQENVLEEIKKTNENFSLNDYVNLENGSKIFDSPTFDGKSGEIGTNGYDGNTLFKVNAVSYVDENNNVTSFNLVGQNEETRKNIQNSQIEFIKNNPNAVVHSIHVTPCNSTGEPELANELGGWTNTTKSQINKIDLNNINQQDLGGMIK